MPKNPGSIDERFAAFHAANPGVYKLFKRFAREARAAGMDQYSARAIMERLRWELKITLKDTGDQYKLNDHYTSRYARLLAAEDTAYETFFAFRRLTAA